MVTRYAYDELGNMTNEVKEVYQIDVPFAQAEVDAEATAITWFEYDKLGRRTHRFLPTIPASLDDTTSNPAREKTVYAKVGSGPYTLRKTIRDFRGITITNDFDSMDRLATRYLPAVNSGEVLRTINFDYTGSLLAKVRENGTGIARTNYYAYDDSRRLRKKDLPEGVLTYSYAPNGQIGAMSMWRRGTVTANAEPDGSSTNNFQVSYGYDALNRLSKVTNSVGTNVWITSYTFDGAGNVDLITGPEIKHDYTYDQRHRAKQLVVSRINGSIHATNQYQFDATGRRTSVYQPVEIIRAPDALML